MTRHAPLSRLDLNLLVALDALLTERSVTRAAERLHLSQPALSAALARLRTHFHDEILSRRGNSYELTALAVRLSEHTTVALDASRRVFESQAEWTPEASTREFVVYGSDYGFATIGAAVARIARDEAPGVRFRFALHNTTIVDDAVASLRSVDAMVIPHGHLTELHFMDLWQDRWVIIADAEHPAVGTGLTLDILRSSPWVMTYRSRSADTAAARQLQTLGIEPRVEAVVESFLALPHFVRGTDRLALVQAGIARDLRAADGIAVLAVPYDATPIVNALWWHPIHERDPEHAWMRSMFQRAGTAVADDHVSDEDRTARA